MSWGFFSNPGADFEDAIAVAEEEFDCVLVAAVGNISDNPGPAETDTLVAWPARLSEVIGVGNMDGYLTRYHDSEYGPDVGLVSVVAPTGQGVPVHEFEDCTSCCDSLVQKRGDCEKSEYLGVRRHFNGTSASAPHVAGIAALIRSRFPSLSAAQVRERIINSAEWYWTGTHQDSLELGHGKVNAYRALTEWGTVSEDTAWGAVSGMPDVVYVSGDLTIAENTTLTLNKGLTIRIAPDHEKSGADTTRVQITVNGTLKTGTAGSGPIVIESFTDGTPAHDDWVGIVFTSTSTNNILDGVTIKNAQVAIESRVPITLKNCAIDSCEIGVISWDEAEIRDSEISNVTDYAVRVLEGDANLIGTEISACEQYGVVAHADTSTDSTSVTMRDCEISDVGVYAMHSHGDHSNLEMREVEFWDADVAGIAVATGYASVESCLVHDSAIGMLEAVTYSTSIKSTNFDDNTTGVQTGYSSNVVLQGDTVRGNTVGVYCIGSDATISNSTVVTWNDDGIKCDLSSDAVVESTTITWNDVGVLAMNSSNPDLGHETGGSSVGYNYFAHSSTYQVENQSGGVTIMAEKNWWRLATGPDTTKIYGSVDYTPWLTTAPTLTYSYEIADVVETPLDGPMQYSLLPNYPNPFNPTTRISYEVPAPGGNVHIAIYDVRGKLVTQLVAAHKQPGRYSYVWNGTDRRGRGVASGIYFVRMIAPNYQTTRKMVLLK